MGQIDDLMASAGWNAPNMGGITMGVLGVIIFILVLGAVIFLGWYLINAMTYKKKVIIFEKVGQGFEPTGRDKAKEFIIGAGGEKVLFLKKRKIWKVGEKQASPNNYWFAILDDGYWYNVTLGDLNKELGEFGTTGISPEMHKLMRFQNAGLRKNLQERHLKKKWWEHPMVGWIGAILFVLIAGIMYIMIGKYYFQEIPQTLHVLNTLTERITNLMEATRHLCPVNCTGG